MSSHAKQPRLVQQWQNRLNTRLVTEQMRRLRAPLAIDFVSNDYLGWARNATLGQVTSESPNTSSHPLLPRFIQLAETFDSIAARGVSGATGSRLLSGQTTAISELEAAIATFHQTEAALLFNSGFDANLGVMAAISDRHTVFLYDELCHASLIDGMRLSISRSSFKFRHNDTAHLAQLLAQYADKDVVVVTESVFSMDGDIAPLAQIAELTQAHGAVLVVDEAHSTAVMGTHGAGLTQSLQLIDAVTVRIHTFGKGMGCHGAAVVGSQTLIDVLINFARPFIYSTAPAPHSHAHIARAYARCCADTHSQTVLQQRIQAFRDRLNQNQQHDWHGLGVRWLDSHTAIQGLIVGNVPRLRAISHELIQQQLDARPIFSPTVAAGSERLRICLHGFNTDEEFDLLLFTLKTALTVHPAPMTMEAV